MFPIHDYHCHSYSAGAQADMLSLYYALRNGNPDVSLAQLFIEKGEFTVVYVVSGDHSYDGLVDMYISFYIDGHISSPFRADCDGQLREA